MEENGNEKLENMLEIWRPNHNDAVPKNAEICVVISQHKNCPLMLASRYCMKIYKGESWCHGPCFLTSACPPTPMPVFEISKMSGGLIVFHRVFLSTAM